MTLAADLKRIASRRNGDINKVAQDALLVMGQRIIVGTPVRDGAARGNWLAAYGAANTSTDEGMTDRGGNQSIRKLQAEINGFAPGTEFFFTNSLPYMPRLENGWSQQAPVGMVKTNIADWQGVVSRSVSRYK